AHDVKPINIKLIPSWKQFLKVFKSPAHNTVGGVHYGVSVQWGPNTLIYNTKKVRPAPTNWNLIYSKKYAGHVTIPNNTIQIADAALYLMKKKPGLGIKDPYELTQSQLTATVNLLKRQKPLLKRFWDYATDEITSFRNGDVWLGAGWPYQTLQLQAAKVHVKEIVPVPTTGWADTWMLASKAPHPNCAYLWMKYVTTPKVEAQQAIVFGETPVNPLACKYMDKLQAGSCTQYHLSAPASYLKSIHFWKVPIADCGWGRRRLHDRDGPPLELRQLHDDLLDVRPDLLADHRADGRDGRRRDGHRLGARLPARVLHGPDRDAATARPALRDGAAAALVELPRAHLLVADDPVDERRAQLGAERARAARPAPLGDSLGDVARVLVHLAPVHG